ncbi:MAG: type IV pilus modification protein PilV [Steroidobacteraceae bacterium]|jgi:type IV pilus assembly protein PilV
MSAMPRTPARAAPARQAGFSLVEVLVALVVCSVGLLGLAKMESLALSSEDVSGTRTIAALQASSLAAMMHADRGYWSSTLATVSAVVTGGALTTNGLTAYSVSDPTLAYGGVPCTTSGATSCTPIQMAAYDLNNWGNGLQILLPGYIATIICTPTVTAAPVTCTITITWIENAVAANSQQQANIGALARPTYTLNVQP